VADVGPPGLLHTADRGYDFSLARGPHSVKRTG
jgi:hypothetical protein